MIYARFLVGMINANRLGRHKGSQMFLERLLTIQTQASASPPQPIVRKRFMNHRLFIGLTLTALLGLASLALILGVFVS